ncbi:BON domain-containing protein [Thiobacillus sedimenti]|uniref:BON domain-containing protein n=1 Tax=Thiobacillus sedimenti TaxID=3110231 RepID=A0ABZ1CMX3_9PROT|nr:BON domain-containing protein [Thiobacillus sp. SCUT-2]WRS40626.1 BON domain-containing protein [Thiobacillus sp. SCUT-2]
MKAINTRIAAGILTSCFVLAPMVSHAADGDTDRSHPVTYVKDSVITSKIKAKLALEHMGSLVQINVDSDAHGVVTLSGYTRTEAQRERAIQIAKSTEGVTKVNSTLTVKKDD